MRVYSQVTYSLGLILSCCIGIVSAQADLPSVTQMTEMAEQIGEALCQTQIVSHDLSWTPERPRYVPTWSDLQRVYLESDRNTKASANQQPYIMMAGYMDTEITWEDGGVFKMLAWVWDADNNVESVELYYEGEATGVYLLDDGNSGDFGPGDTLYGLTFDIPAYSLPEGEYILELRARDLDGNLSDLWPYLTIHP